jgi:hypothetical protein
MTPEQLVQAAAPKIGALGASFYFHPDTMAVGLAHGVKGYRWYILGRGGVLGDVEAPVVKAAFGYFAPGLLGKLWDSARAVLPAREAGHVYHGCCAAIGRVRFSAIPELDAFNVAMAKIVAAQSPDALPMFAGIAAEPLSDDAAGRALQLTAVARELRGSLHLVAVLASGLSTQVAHYLKRPNDYELFGWTDPPEVRSSDTARLDAAERMTDELVLDAFAAVTEDEADLIVRVLTAMEAATAAAG